MVHSRPGDDGGESRMVRIGKVFIIGTALWASAASALTMKTLNLEEMTDLAGTVFLGTVLSVNTIPSSSGSPASIVTQFRVLETYKGIESKEITLRQFGKMGALGKIQTFPGLPRFSVGETAVVFAASATTSGLASPIGMGQGVFRMVATKPSDEGVVVNELQNRRLLDRLQGSRVQAIQKGLLIRSPKSPESKLTLRDLRDLVQAHRGVGQ